MPIWGFIFVLAAALTFLFITYLKKSLITLGWCLFAIGFILTYTTSSNPIHF